MPLSLILAPIAVGFTVGIFMAGYPLWAVFTVAAIGAIIVNLVLLYL